jgi:AGZA family xanthine/uracil permease-like MFS transporter
MPLERLFHLREAGTTVRTEVVGGITTFMTMAYIVFVNPAVLSQAGMDFGAVMAATCLSAALGTLVMGIVANYPIALAPGMGENFFFLTAVLGMGITWQQSLGAVFLAGILFLLLNAVRLRQAIIDAIPETLKFGIAAGIGLFIVFIGLVDAGIVQRHPVSPVVPVRLGTLNNPATWVALLGLLLTSVLLVRRVRGAILLGILGTGILGALLGVTEFHGIVSRPPSLAPTFFKMDVAGALSWAVLPVTLIFLYMAVFDAIGTLIGVGEQAGLLRNGKLVRGTRALMADASGTVVGACLGTSTVTAYIESSAGVAAGARTGLANLVTGGLFLLALFFHPLVETIGGGYEVQPGVFLYPITAPALIVVGSFMAANLRRIPWQEPSEAIPGLLTVVGIPLTYSIADGLAFGFISYPLIKLLGGRAREVSILSYVVGALFLARYLFLAH